MTAREKRKRKKGTSRKRSAFLHVLMARPERFERPTPWFVAKYSIQLSYGRAAKLGETPEKTSFPDYCQISQPGLSLSSGAPGAIRTPDPLVRSQVLYPTELRARCKRARILLKKAWIAKPFLDVFKLPRNLGQPLLPTPGPPSRARMDCSSARIWPMLRARLSTSSAAAMALSSRRLRAPLMVKPWL